VDTKREIIVRRVLVLGITGNAKSAFAMLTLCPRALWTRNQ